MKMRRDRKKSSIVNKFKAKEQQIMQQNYFELFQSNTELGDWASCLNDKEFAEVVEQYINPQFYSTEQQVIIDEGVVQNVYPDWQSNDETSQPSVDPRNIFFVYTNDHPSHPFTLPPPEPQPQYQPQPQPQPSPSRKRQSPQKRKRDINDDEDYEQSSGSGSGSDSGNTSHNPTSPPPKKKYYKKKNVPLESVDELEVSSEMGLAITEIRGKYGKDLHTVPLVTFDYKSWRATLSRKKNCVILRSDVELPALQLKIQHVSRITYFTVCITVGEIIHVVNEDGIHLYYLHFELKSAIDFGLKRTIEGAQGKRGCAIPLYEVKFDVCDRVSGSPYCSFTGCVKRRAK